MDNKDKKITGDLVSSVVSRITSGREPAEIKSFISEQTGYKRTKSSNIYQDILKSVNFPDDIFDFDITNEETDKPSYNPELKKYVVYIKSLGRNIVVSNSTHDKILELYSDWDGEGSTLNEICRVISWPRQVLTSYIKAFGKTKDCLPLSDEDLQKYDDEELTGRLLELRKFSLYQKFEKESWNLTRAAANKWYSFEHKQLNPFVDAINSWTAPKVNISLEKNKIKGSNSLLAVLSDTHLGLSVSPDLTFRRAKMNTETIGKRIIELSERICEDASNQNLSEINVMFLGDLINSCNTLGTTNKGTVLQNDMVGGELVKYSLDIFSKFLLNLVSLNIPIRCCGVTGNHEGALGYGILYAIKAFLKNEIKDFDVSHRFIDKIIIKNSLVCYSHGAHWDAKIKVPTGPKVRDYAERLFLEAKSDKINSNYLICADLHHFRAEECNSGEYFLVPSIAGSSNFSDALNLKSRARQMTFLFDDNGIKNINNYFFD